MILNEWEQSNIEVLTSREMGEWLSRRENRLLDKIRADIEDFCKKSNITCDSSISACLDIIDKYREEQSE